MHPKSLLALACCCLSFSAAAAERSEDRWNLADLYPSVAAWNADAAILEAKLKQFGDCRGHLGDSARFLRSCLDRSAQLRRRYARLRVYAGEQHAEDTGVSASLELVQRAEVLGNRYSEATSFVRPEVLRLGADQVGRFLAQEPALKIYRQPLDNILRAAPHTLDAPGEALIASFGLATDAADSVYTILANADAVYTKVRHYPDTRARALDRNKLPAAIYDTLIAESKAELPTLHRYFKLRAKMLGVDEMRRRHTGRWRRA